ncbi:hypothetical protein KXR64_20520 [Brucella intermedia]|uniref:hypothetical protein n=1 Tax=Brucella TaxID=234 RepID=UPI0011154107|nr:hypothetical protein [Brucella intermedia]
MQISTHTLRFGFQQVSNKPFPDQQDTASRLQIAHPEPAQSNSVELQPGKTASDPYQNRLVGLLAEKAINNAPVKESASQQGTRMEDVLTDEDVALLKKLCPDMDFEFHGGYSAWIRGSKDFKLPEGFDPDVAQAQLDTFQNLVLGLYFQRIGGTDMTGKALDTKITAAQLREFFANHMETVASPEALERCLKSMEQSEQKPQA